MSKILRTGVLTAVLAAILSVSAMAASIGGGTVNSASVNLRYAAGTESQVRMQVCGGEKVIISDSVTQEGWYRVVFNGKVGYMSAEHVTFSENLFADFGTGQINGDSVCMRATPGAAGDIVGTYNTGVKMQVLGVSSEWYKVMCDGVSGYIHSDFVSLKGHGAADAESPGQKIVDIAMKYLGTPYVWAGTSTSGFDCSGFVYYVYKECGVDINRTAASIYNNGSFVEKSSLAPGDAVCFTTTSSSEIGHVGIYIGDGEFIHSSSSSGGVIISDLGTDYNMKHYVGARRIV